MSVFCAVLLLLLIPFGYAVHKSSAPFLLLSVPAVYALCCAVNLGDAWMGGRAELRHLAASALYVVFWAVFTFASRASRGMLRLCQLAAALTLGAGVTGLLARVLSFAPLLIPALLLSPLSSVPMFGLRRFLEWEGLEVVTVLLSGVWLAVSTLLIRRQKKVANSVPPS